LGQGVGEKEGPPWNPGLCHGGIEKEKVKGIGMCTNPGFHRGIKNMGGKNEGKREKKTTGVYRLQDPKSKGYTSIDRGNPQIARKEKDRNMVESLKEITRAKTNPMPKGPNLWRSLGKKTAINGLGDPRGCATKGPPWKMRKKSFNRP